MKNRERLVAQGGRIREIREKLSISPDEIARLLQFGNRQSVYDLEKGKRDIKAWEAVKLASHFGISLEKLVCEESPSEIPVFWRGEADVYAENQLRTRLERYIKLENLAGISCESSMPRYKLDKSSTFESVGEIACEVARSLNLGEYPARSLAEAIRKKWNVVVFCVPLNLGSAACTYTDSACAVLLNSNDAWWRRNFSLGHELFHLLFEDAPGVPEKRVETLANIFSSNLLMPFESISTEIRKLRKVGNTSYFDLMNLAREYTVSTEALLWRLYSLGFVKRADVQKFVSDEDLRALDGEVHGSSVREEPQLPADLVFLAYKVYLHGRISIGKLAEYLETSVGLLKQTLISYGIEPFARVYEATISNS